MKAALVKTKRAAQEQKCGETAKTEPPTYSSPPCQLSGISCSASGGDAPSYTRRRRTPSCAREFTPLAGLLPHARTSPYSYSCALPSSSSQRVFSSSHYSYPDSPSYTSSLAPCAFVRQKSLAHCKHLSPSRQHRSNIRSAKAHSPFPPDCGSAISLTSSANDTPLSCSSPAYLAARLSHSLN